MWSSHLSCGAMSFFEVSKNWRCCVSLQGCSHFSLETRQIRKVCAIDGHKKVQYFAEFKEDCQRFPQPWILLFHKKQKENHGKPDRPLLHLFELEFLDPRLKSMVLACWPGVKGLLFSFVAPPSFGTSRLWAVLSGCTVVSRQGKAGTRVLERKICCGQLWVCILRSKCMSMTYSMYSMPTTKTRCVVIKGTGHGSKDEHAIHGVLLLKGVWLKSTFSMPAGNSFDE